MTDGVLLQERVADPLLMKYSVIILDEAHVSSKNMDFLIPLLRDTRKLRKDFRLVISRYCRSCLEI